MSHPIMTEVGYTKFNLSYPVVMANDTSTGIYSDGTNETPLPGLLIGLLLPHIICTLFILARFFSRLLLLRKWFPDDTLILLAWAAATAVCLLSAIPFSPTRSPTTPPRRYPTLILHQLTLLLTKLSILAFYHRIFSPPLPPPGPPPTNHHHHHNRLPTPTTTTSPPPNANPTTTSKERTLTRLTLLLAPLATLPLLLLAVLQCHPAPGLWFGRPMPRCAALPPLLVSGAAVHAALDLWLVALVVPCVARLREVGRRRRVGLGVVLSLGVVGAVVGVVRGVVLFNMGGGDGDGGGWLFVLTVLELDVAVICASAPTLRPVLARLGVGREWGEGERGWEGRSVDLTSVVSYHGYPWTRNGTPAGSKNASAVDVVHVVGGGGREGVPPMPPMPLPAVVAVHRTPTTLSLRSFVSGMAPRSRGRMEGEDRAGLLGEDAQGGGVDGMSSRRRSSVGLEAYYEQFMGHDDAEKRRSFCKARDARRSRGSQCYSGQWGDSQESFVLGMNDPNSPKRLSPLSSLSEATRAELRRPGSQNEKGTMG